MVIESNFLFSKAIPVGDYFGAEPEAATITLRETTVANAAKFQAFGNDAAKSTALFLELLPGLIEDHELFKDEITKFTGAEVAAMVAARAELGMYLMGKWTAEVLFTHGRKSDAS